MPEIIEGGGGEVVDIRVAAPTLGAGPDLDFAPPGPALIGLQDGTDVLGCGSDGFLHLLLSATDNATGAVAALTGFSVQMAVADASGGLPVSPALTWLAATWLTPAAGGAYSVGGAYATLGAGPEHALLLPVGQYWLYARVAAGTQVYVLRSGSPFLVRP